MGAAKPTPAAIRRAIQAMEEAGKPVEGLRVMGDGSVFILASIDRAPLPSPKGEVDAWDEATGL